jgi:hypothetical protein
MSDYDLTFATSQHDPRNADLLLEELDGCDGGLTEEQIRQLIEVEKETSRRYLIPAFARRLAQRGRAEKGTLQTILQMELNVHEDVKDTLEGLLAATAQGREDDLFIARFTAKEANAAVGRIIARDDISVADLLPLLKNSKLSKEAKESLKLKILSLDDSKETLKKILNQSYELAPAVEQILDKYLTYPLSLGELSELARIYPKYERISQDALVLLETETALPEEPGTASGVLINIMVSHPSLAHRAGKLLLGRKAQGWYIAKMGEYAPELEEEAWAHFIASKPDARSLPFKSEKQSIQNRAATYLVSLGTNYEEVMEALKSKPAPECAEILWKGLIPHSLSLVQLAKIAEAASALEGKVLAVLETLKISNENKNDLRSAVRSAQKGSSVQRYLAKISMQLYPDARNLGMLFGLNTGLEEEILALLASEKTDLSSVQHYCMVGSAYGSSVVFLEHCWKKIAREGKRADLIEMLTKGGSIGRPCWEVFLSKHNPTQQELQAIIEHGSSGLSLKAAEALYAQYSLSEGESAALAQHRNEKVRQLAWSDLHRTNPGEDNPKSPGKDNLLSIVLADPPWNGEDPQESLALAAFQEMESRGFLTIDDASNIFVKKCQKNKNIAIKALDYLVKNKAGASRIIRALEHTTPKSNSLRDFYGDMDTYVKHRSENQQYVLALEAAVVELQAEEEEARRLKQLIHKLKEEAFVTANGLEHAVKSLIGQIRRRIEAENGSFYEIPTC